MKRILIDGRFIGVGESMTRYTLEILRGILALDKENEYTLLIRPQGLATAKGWLKNFMIRASSFKFHVLDIPHYSLGEQTQLLSYLNREKFDLVHFIQFNHPVRYKRPFVVTVHDLTLVGYLHRANPIKKLAFGKVMASAVLDSKKVITVSEFSKKEIIDYYHIDSSKVEVVYNGLDHERYNTRAKSEERGLSPENVGTVPSSERERRRVEDFKKKYDITDNYLLYTGAWKKHKNLIRLLKAYEKFLISNAKFLNKSQCQNSNDCHSGLDPESSFSIPQLVLVGKIDKSEPEVLAEIDRINFSLMRHPEESAIGGRREDPITAEGGKMKSIVATGYIPEEELPLAYAGALAYIIPSLSEGFGLPPLEAMASGVSVISSKESCMPEILGDAPLYFDPYDVDDIAAAIEKVVGNEALRQKLIQKGLEQAEKYDWDKTARETLEVYRSVLGSI